MLLLGAEDLLQFLLGDRLSGHEPIQHIGLRAVIVVVPRLAMVAVAGNGPSDQPLSGGLLHFAQSAGQADSTILVFQFALYPTVLDDVACCLRERGVVSHCGRPFCFRSQLIHQAARASGPRSGS